MQSSSWRTHLCEAHARGLVVRMGSLVVWDLGHMMGCAWRLCPKSRMHTGSSASSVHCVQQARIPFGCASILKVCCGLWWEGERLIIINGNGKQRQFHIWFIWESTCCGTTMSFLLRKGGGRQIENSVGQCIGTYHQRVIFF